MENEVIFNNFAFVVKLIPRKHLLLFFLSDSNPGSCEMVYYTWQSASEGRVTQWYKPTLSQYAIHKWNQTDLRTSSTHSVIRALNFLQLALWFQAKPCSCNREHMTLCAFFTHSLITPKLTTTNVKKIKRITHLCRSGLVCLKGKMLHFSKPPDGLV